MVSRKINLALRLKPTEVEQNTYRLNQQKTELQLFIEPNKSEPYYFSSIFEPQETNRQVFEQIGAPVVDQLLSGENATLLACGDDQSGKSHTLLGHLTDSGLQNGISIPILHELFEQIQANSEQMHIGVVVSFFEIFNDSVRDLGLAYTNKHPPVLEVYDKQNLPVKEAQGRSYIEGVSLVQVMTAQEIIEIITSGFLMRKQLEKSKGPIQNFSHTILTITVSQKLKSANAYETKSGRLNIVELVNADTQNLDYNVEKSNLSKPENSLQALKYILNKLFLSSKGVQIASIPYKCNKLTHCLQNSLSGSSLNTLIATVDTSPSKLPQTQNLLEYLKSIFYIDKKLRRVTKISNKEGGIREDAERMQRLLEEISDFKDSIQKAESSYKFKLKQFGKLIGIKTDLERIANAEAATSEFKLAEKHRDAISTVEQLKSNKQLLEKKLYERKKLMEEIKIVQMSNNAKRKRELTELQNTMIEFKHKIEGFKDINFGGVEDQTLTENLEKLLLNTHLVLEEKSAAIQNIRHDMKGSSSDARNLAEVIELSRAQEESSLRQTFKENEAFLKIKLENIKEQFSAYIKEKEEVVVNFRQEIATYNKKKDKETLKLKQEALSLFQVVQQQGKLIHNIEEGTYNKGIKPILIPNKDRIQPPDPQKYPYLFKYLGPQNAQARLFKRTFSQTLLSSSKNTFSSSRSLRKLTNPLEDSPAKSKVLPEEVPKTELNTLNASNLKDYGKSLQEVVRSLKSKIDNLEEKEVTKSQEIQKLQSELETLKSEKETLQQKYSVLVRNRIDAKDSQEKGLFVTESLSRVNSSNSFKRPATTIYYNNLRSHKRPVVSAFVNSTAYRR